jgi:hypothetical protein
MVRLKNCRIINGVNVFGKGFSKHSSKVPSVTSEFGEIQNPFPNSEALAMVHKINS